MATESFSSNSLPSPSTTDARKRKVTYFYDSEIGNYYYGPRHSMRHHRIRMAHTLVLNYGLHNNMDIVSPLPADTETMSRFHSDDYIDFLESITPKTCQKNEDLASSFNFDQLFEFCQASAGGSLGATVKLNNKDADIAINWAGGLHHAKKSKASGFCYVNDIVLGIIELLKVHKRVMYVDIDIHHGDGVEEAFFTTDRVMTVSFHKYGPGFFPHSGSIKDVGVGKGKYYALNVPLKDGMDDAGYRDLFQPIIRKAIQVYQAEAIVVQCGADSLADDVLGIFNLSVKGHADCLKFLRSFDIPLMVLGGGGYSIRNVARCWCYATAVAVGVELDNELPDNEYNEYFVPDYILHADPIHTVPNRNSERYLEELRVCLLEQLSKLSHAPSVQFQTAPPHYPISKSGGRQTL